MVFPIEHSPLSSSKKNQLLKPHLTLSSSIDRSEASQNPSPPDLKTLSFNVTFNGWRIANIKFKSWATKMSALHEPIWRKAGIFEAVMASTHRIPRNTELVLGIVEKWCPETKTFVFPWGETTITLEDVKMLLGFSVLGSPVFATLDSSGEKIIAKLKQKWLNLKKDRNFVTQVLWMNRFMDSGDEFEHVGFLVLWLSYFVFPSRFYYIDEAILPIAVHLSIGTKIALAPAVLAHLYADLSLLKAFNESSPINVKLELSGLFKLVQVWTWERFRKLQPKPNLLLEGKPRISRWSDLKQTTSIVRQILDKSKMDSFEWRPYTKTLKNWDFPKFYPEKAMWVPVDPSLDDDFISFARFIKVSELVGIESVEHYFPNRVASQFGMLQDVSCPPVNRNNLSKEAAWSDYNKPIDDLTLYIPSIYATPCVTPMFCEWWTKRDVVSAETLKSRTIIGDDDNNFVPSGSKMKRRSKDGLDIAEDSSNKRCKQAHENDESSTMGHSQKPVQSDNDDDEDDSLSVAQSVRLRKKKCSDVMNSGGDASEPLGKKSRPEADNNEETVSPPEIEQRNEGAYESMGLNPSNESNVHIEVEDGSQGHDFLLHDDGLGGEETIKSNEKLGALGKIKEEFGDDGLGSEETMKSNEESEEVDKGNENFGEDDDVDIEATEKRFEDLKLLASSIEERINQTERNVAWLKERRAIKQKLV